VIGDGGSAATTVAGTMILAHKAGIRVFATGGLGGVHRGAEVSLDISADLLELGRTPVAVVCGGVKSILDVPKTLEVLETQGVPVLTFGGGTEFPAFFTNESGIDSPLVARDAGAVARMLRASDALGLSNGAVVAVPNPQPASGSVIGRAIDDALAAADAEGVTGAATTPYLLASIEQRTGGSSLDANIALVLNNARVACDIAKAYSNITRRAGDPAGQAGQDRDVEIDSVTHTSAAAGGDTSSGGMDTTTASTTGPADVLVFGGAVVDTVGSLNEGVTFIPGSSNPGSIVQSYGGVARNVSEGLGRLGTRVGLVAAVGHDAAGVGLLAYTEAAGVDLRYVLRPSTGATASYMAIHRADGDLVGTS